MKILHISIKASFISDAINTFEKNYPGSNEVWLYTKGELGSLPITINCPVTEISKLNLLSPRYANKLKNYNLVVLHSLSSSWFPLVLLANKKIKFVWISWGYDIYSLIDSTDMSYLLGKTRDCYLANTKKSNNLKKALRNTLISRVLKKIQVFTSGFEDEYRLLKAKNKAPKVFARWHYGDTEKIIKDVKNKKRKGKNILIGNSSAYSNNLLEVIDLIKGIKNQKLIIPLAYGDKTYANEVKRSYLTRISSDVEFIDKFMQLDEYIDKLTGCGFVIMNHMRQQAVGNILLMMYLGARVFIREENPIFNWFKENNFIFNSVQELAKDKNLLDIVLTDEEIKQNRDSLEHTWSAKLNDVQTMSLVKGVMRS